LVTFLFLFLLWTSQMSPEEKFIVWASDPLVKIFKDTKPTPNAETSLYVEAVRNEYAAAQFAITVEKGNPKVHLKVEPLEGPNGFKINFSTNFVGYVPVAKNTPNTPGEELVHPAPFDFPDPLLNVDSVCLKSGETQPVWITIFVPPEAPPGNYTGKVYVFSEKANASVQVTLKVYPVILNSKRTLWLTNWFNVEGLANYYNVKAWSEEHWKLIRSYARFISKYRQNVIITPVLQLIKFIEASDGTIRCDFSNFDRWVELFIEEGVVGRIEGGHLAFRREWEAKDFFSYEVTVYKENGIEAYKLPSMNVTSKEYYSFLSEFLPQLQKHLEEKGWISIYIQHLTDEPIPVNSESYRIFAGYVKELAPKIKIIEANQATEELVGALDVWVPLLNQFDENQAFYNQRKAAGEEVWFYTCLAPTGKYPNRFIDYSLIKVRVLHWINFKYNLSGYLHWGLNYWSEDPFKNVEPNNLPPGDAFIIYPGKEGPLSSIRFEVLRLGVQDYELLKMLEEKNPTKARELANEVVRTITDYEKDISKFNEVRKQLVTSLSQME
ncbi:MAG: glycoside hydrolase domain-containing protein, partial [Thermoproteota archaeon]